MIKPSVERLIEVLESKGYRVYGISEFELGLKNGQSAL